jgi:hypothetical protein
VWECVGFVPLAVGGLLLMWWLDSNRRRGREFEAGLVARQPLSDAEMVSRYFAADLDMVALMEDLEADFAITIPDEEAERTPCTIRGVALLVARRTCQTADAPDRAS